MASNIHNTLFESKRPEWWDWKRYWSKRYSTRQLLYQAPTTYYVRTGFSRNWKSCRRLQKYDVPKQWGWCKLLAKRVPNLPFYSRRVYHNVCACKKAIQNFQSDQQQHWASSQTAHIVLIILRAHFAWQSTGHQPKEFHVLTTAIYSNENFRSLSN